MKLRHFAIYIGVILLTLPLAAGADWHKIADDVQENIRRAGNLGYYEVTVDVKGQSITLIGKVRSQEAKDRVEAIARMTPPVSMVTNNLVIEPSFAARAMNQESNPELSAKLHRELAKYPNFNQNTFKVDLNSSVPTITGTVRTVQDRGILEQVVRDVVGARVVNNLTVVQLPESDDSLAARVRDSITRINGVDLSGIEVSARNGVVSFSGERQNHRQVDRILSLALMVDGVKDLRNEIELRR